MRSFHGPLVALVFLLAAPGCAARGEEDDGTAAGAMRGSPAEPAAEAELLRKNRWLQAVDMAYDAAAPADFTALPLDGTGLVGEARVAFAETTRACAATQGRARAHTWKVKLAASPEDATVKVRRYFVLSTLDSRARTMGVSIHDESGTFVVGRLYGFGQSAADEWEPDTSPRFSPVFRRCSR